MIHALAILGEDIVIIHNDSTAHVLKLSQCIHHYVGIMTQIRAC